MAFISLFKKSAEKSNIEMQGNGGFLALIGTSEVTWSANTHVKPFRLLECSSLTAFTTLEFTPEEGSQKGTAVDMTGIIDDTLTETTLLGEVMRVSDGAGGFEVVRGSWTKIQCSAGQVKAYGGA